LNAVISGLWFKPPFVSLSLQSALGCPQHSISPSCHGHSTHPHHTTTTPLGQPRACRVLVPIIQQEVWPPLRSHASPRLNSPQPPHLVRPTPPTIPPATRPPGPHCAGPTTKRGRSRSHMLHAPSAPACNRAHRRSSEGPKGRCDRARRYNSLLYSMQAPQPRHLGRMQNVVSASACRAAGSDR
jgi:hypothetical protein